MIEKAEVGQVVWLNSGGNPMTVTGTETAANVLGARQSPGEVCVKAFSDKFVSHDRLSLKCLSATNPFPEDQIEIAGEPMTLDDVKRAFSAAFPNLKADVIFRDSGDE